MLWDVSFEIAEGEIVALIGPNGAGKTTLLRNIVGLMNPYSGEIYFMDKVLNEMPAYKRARMGIALVPEGGRVFPKLNVVENLEIGASERPESLDKMHDTLEFVFNLFPRLSERKKQLAGTLSGGEQRMLSIARGIMMRPKLMLIDELSLGLAPFIVKEIYDALVELHKIGITILLVEQYVKKALETSQRGLLIENGRIVMEGPSSELKDNEYIKNTYLGIK